MVVIPIYMIRHGVAQHNVVGGKEGRNLFDTSLTPHGKTLIQETAVMMRDLLVAETQQGISSGSTATTMSGDTITNASASSTSTSCCNNDSATNTILPYNITIISSPLSRCLETSMILHSKLSTIATTTTESSSIGTNSSTAVLYCHELLREAYGIYKSDCRRKKSELELLFPSFQFDLQMSEEDCLWTSSHRETLRSINGRIQQFFHHLATNHTNILPSNDNNNNNNTTVVILVTHGVWMECCLHHYAPHLMEDGRRVYNGDIYRAELNADHRPVQLNNVQFISSGFR